MATFLSAPFNAFLFHTLVYGVLLLFRSRLKLFGRLLTDLDHPPPARPELPPEPDDAPPPPRPLPPFLFSLIMSSRDMLILSAIVAFKLFLALKLNTNKELWVPADGGKAATFPLWRGVEAGGNA